MTAAERIRKELQRAKDGNYLHTGWYSYISREDVEALLEELEKINGYVAETKKALERRVDSPLTTGEAGDSIAHPVTKPCRRVVVDWDGVCVPERYPDRPRKWLPGAPAALAAFLAKGCDVKIHSCRTHSMARDFNGPNPDQQGEVIYIRKMLDSAGLHRVGIVLDDKPPADLYIDDRAVRFENWEAILRELG